MGVVDESWRDAFKRHLFFANCHCFHDQKTTNPCPQVRTAPVVVYAFVGRASDGPRGRARLATAVMDRRPPVAARFRLVDSVAAVDPVGLAVVDPVAAAVGVAVAVVAAAVIVAPIVAAASVVPPLPAAEFVPLYPRLSRRCTPAALE